MDTQKSRSNRALVKHSQPTDSLSAELAQLAADSVVKLRSRYKLSFGGEPPKSFGPDLLRRIIAHRIQQRACGSLSRFAQRLLDQSVKAQSIRPSGALSIPRQIKPGSELVREWKGKTYRVIVKPDGFAYNAKNYAGLSEIASLITGTNWNGPRFFGLRAKTEGATANGK